MRKRKKKNDEMKRGLRGGFDMILFNFCNKKNRHDILFKLADAEKEQIHMIR